MLEDDVALLLEDFGSDLTLNRSGAPVYDPATGLLSASAGATFSVRGVFINYTDANIDGSIIERGDRRLLVRAKGAGGTPAVGDRVNGFQILDVRTIAPNGVPIAWACQARGTEIAVVPWILAGGVWNDLGVWDDTATWSDAA